MKSSGSRSPRSDDDNHSTSSKVIPPMRRSELVALALCGEMAGTRTMAMAIQSATSTIRKSKLINHQSPSMEHGSRVPFLPRSLGRRHRETLRSTQSPPAPDSNQSSPNKISRPAVLETTCTRRVRSSSGSPLPSAMPRTNSRGILIMLFEVPVPPRSHSRAISPHGQENCSQFT